jgi:3-isopropylmalate/(R)-2-methylmalate dehydratase large subunit
MATLIEKIFSRHAGKRIQAGDIVDLEVDIRAARDFGGANVVQNLQKYHLPIEDPSKTIFTFDCNPTGSDQKYAENQQICRMFGRKHQLRVYDIDQGIGSHLVIDKGLVGPGDTFISTDSHANILGAIGAFGQGMGDVDVAYTFSHGKNWFQVPPTLKIMVTGHLPDSCSAKDLTLALLRQFGADGLLGSAAEIYGDAIDNLDLAGRITLASMATEMAGIIILIPPSDAVNAYCRSAGADFEPVYADPDAIYKQTVELDISNLEPLISKPGHPENVVPVREIVGLPVDSVFIGSCTNGRYEDMRAAAEIMRGRRIADHLVCKIVPATDAIWQRCMKEGLFDCFKEAGALISNAGCGGCAVGQVGQNGPDEITVSTGNRNFFGKQGKGSVYLTSPATAAATAVAGRIVSLGSLESYIEKKLIGTAFETKKIRPSRIQIKRKKQHYPTLIKGRIWIINQDHIDTDMIYHNRFLTITDYSEMGQYTFKNLKGWENFAVTAQSGDVIITGHNFGCGSSRQQAVDCFKSLGIGMIIARSFSAIFERNAINSAFPVLQADLLNGHLKDGDIIEVNLNTGKIQPENGTPIQGHPFSEIQMNIYQRGGLL